MISSRSVGSVIVVLANRVVNEEPGVSLLQVTFIIHQRDVLAFVG